MGTHLPSFKHQMCCRGEGERFLLMKLNGELFHAFGKMTVSFQVLTSICVLPLISWQYQRCLLLTVTIKS